MTTSITSISARATTDELASLLTGCGRAAVPVVDDDGAPVGIVGEREVLRAALMHSRQLWRAGHGDHGDRTAQVSGPRPGSDAATGAGLVTLRVEEIMRGRGPSVHPDDELACAARLLLRSPGGLVLVTSEGRMVGVLRIADVLDRLTPGVTPGSCWNRASRGWDWMIDLSGH